MENRGIELKTAGRSLPLSAPLFPPTAFHDPYSAIRALQPLLLLIVLPFLGCARWLDKPATMPLRNELVRDQLVIYSDTPLPSQHRMLEELCQQRTDLLAKLALPASNEPIHVYLFDTSERFGNFVQLHYPSFPSRRAFFVETDTRLNVYAHWGDRVAEDLRHEVAHGYLHSVVPNLPLWLDEGLAEYFEVPRGHAGLNVPHVQDLRSRLSAGWRPDLRRLEALSSVNEMTQLDYAEAWAWAHFLLETSPERCVLLRSFLQTLRRDAAAEPLSLQLRRQMPQPEGPLLLHLQSLVLPR
jgi:hypothetical protein